MPSLTWDRQAVCSSCVSLRLSLLLLLLLGLSLLSLFLPFSCVACRLVRPLLLLLLAPVLLLEPVCQQGDMQLALQLQGLLKQRPSHNSSNGQADRWFVMQNCVPWL